MRVQVRSMDVIHSFFLPNFRVKQDAMPGMTIDIWFTPTELGDFEPIERNEWVPEAHAHRHFATMGLEPEGDAITGRRLLMWNQDVEISLCRPDEEMDYFFRNGEGDEVIFVHEGTGVVETM